VNVRVDGLAVVLGPLLSDARITAAALVDVDSGMVLDAWSAAGGPDGALDLEMLGAQHAEVMRCALALLREWPDGPDGPEGPDCPDGSAGSGGAEVVLGVDGGVRHLLRTVPDPHGDRLALAVVVDGPQRVLDRVRKRLRTVAVDALTAGPSMSRRPVFGTWSFAMPAPDVPATPESRTAPIRTAGTAHSGVVAARTHGPGSDPVAGGTPGAPQPPSRQPALTRVDVGRMELPVARAFRSAMSPAPPAAAPPRIPRVDLPDTGPPPGPAPAVAEPVPERTASSAGDGARRPSPPAALPAPAPPRQRER
jgi:hypothetical protein